MKLFSKLAALAVLGVSTSSYAVVLVNPGFETDNAAAADVPGATGWGGFNDRFTTRAVTPHAGLQSLKVFGPFSSGGGAGVVQGGFAATPGQTWSATAFARNDSSDALTSGDFAQTQLQFLNAAGAVLTTFSSANLTDLSPTNVWVQQIATGVAPAGTATAQIVLVKVQIDPIGGGSVFFDDATLGVVPEPTSLGLLSVGGLALLRRRRA